MTNQRADGYEQGSWKGPRSLLMRQSIDTPGVYRLDFPRKFRTFSFKNVVAATGLAGSAIGGEVYVALSTTDLDRATIPIDANIREALCPLQHPVVRLDAETDTVYILVVSATALEELRVTGIAGSAEVSGQAAAASAVTISGQPIEIKEGVATSTATRSSGVVSVAQVSVEIVAANASRLDLVIQNHGADPVAIEFGAVAVFGSTPIILPQYQTWSMREHGIVLPDQVRAIRDAASTDDVGYIELD